MGVPARISLVTLGVDDVARATEFYVALGWRLSSSSVPGEVSFLDTAGSRLGLWSNAELAAEAYPGMTPSHVNVQGVALAINVGSPAEVDDAIAAAEAAGARIVQRPRAMEWGGYSGYFADPDGHAWEVAHNPGWPLGDDGLPQLP